MLARHPGAQNLEFQVFMRVYPCPSVARKSFLMMTKVQNLLATDGHGYTRITNKRNVRFLGVPALFPVRSTTDQGVLIKTLEGGFMPERSNLFGSHWSNQWLTQNRVIFARLLTEQH